MLNSLYRLMPCLRPTQQMQNLDESRGMRVNSCTFCNVSVEAGFNVVYEDDEFFAFKDHKPAAVHHIQVIPKAHIDSVKSLRQEDAELVKHMETIGHKLLDKFDVDKSMRVMGFHIPPFNSVYHLHLHVQAMPYTSSRRAAKYPVSIGYGTHQKGFSWFVEVGQAIRILEQGHRIQVLPC
ncbi:HIT-like domain-containing protein [Cyathus striatus]|nr:HIT-like domain-containing protein [Cyathus striatus]